ncbi:MAG TPA: Asp23/Gls24 family envelope stress response protein [Bacillota bacterium]|nr:Asp23/Gls24 family envelope stress response protein [Bacillota bacterium]HOP69235.1 Asp23/Gls24 family envelope stress response protein [Bacillota bacterium]HPT34094.1 Asp23/Gls24 family envelope stress response protein [Bacillota bacterium]HPZ65588.1 Asp23/Gls24 family envelope stress response protein [Bacillota bacterium]HQD05877.1 Asp23/Gls24 family envelope stress response protein [Bacillota bacterium]
MEEKEKKNDETMVVQQANDSEADSVRISTEVIAILAGIAASEVPGIAGMSGGIVGGITEMLGRKDFAKGIKVYLEDRKVRIDLNVIVEYGVKIMDTAKQLKQAVRKTVEETTGLQVAAINVNVMGINLANKSGEEK